MSLLDESQRTVEQQPVQAGPERPKSRRGVSWTLINFWLDAVLLVAFLALVWLSVMLRYVFPAGTAAQGWELWGLGYDRWIDVQFAVLCVLAAGVLLHVMFHWSWVCGVAVSQVAPHWFGKTKPDDGTRTIIGVGLLIGVLLLGGALIGAAVLSVHQP